MAREKTTVHSVKRLHSIRVKLLAIMVLLLAVMVFVFYFMSYQFLSPFYENSKASLLEESYSDTNNVLNADTAYRENQEDLSSDSQLKLEIIGENNSVDLYVIRVVNFLGSMVYSFDYPGITQGQQDIVQNLAASYIYGGRTTSEDRSLIKKQDAYMIFKTYDSRIGSYYMELFGTLDTGAYIYLRTSYQSMSESIQIFNRFMVYSGIVAVFLAVIVMIFIGKRFADPIVQITDIAKRMSELDFEVKYPVKTHDEIGVLGSSINTLSETLEETISELKSANNELQKDIEKKTQIDEMRKEFLSNVSHELKTPIALIQGYAEGLQDNINDDSGGREFYCEVIIDEAKKMNKMVKKLLTLNQIEFGNEQVAFEHFDIVGLIGSVIQSAGLLAKQKDAWIGFDRDYPPIYVWADEYMVEEVVTNYISNAIHHVDFEKKITVSLEGRDKVVRIRVHNTGKPIPQEDLDKVWIKFYKVDKARTREYGGSGIGLSIVKAIMDSLHRGYGVENKENGVEFWFELDRQSKGID